MTTLEIHLDAGATTRHVGTAHLTRARGRVTTTFLYDPAYLASGGPGIDPTLALDPGAQHVPGLLPALADTAPDRWGRNLIDKAERARAREERRAPRHLDDVDYLLGVSDDTRQGALRVRVAGTATFLGPPATVPRLIELPALLHAAREVTSADDPSTAVKQLLDTGTTGLGGARPKASVRLDDGALAIAKFPHASDRWDVMAWEATALDLMVAAGIRVPPHRLIRVGGASVLVLSRFDRLADGTRIPYVSVMTALGATDGDHRDYAEVAEAVRDLSSSPRRDLDELYRRVVFSVAIGNTDDHLRNHGLLADTTRGWRLSPAFDVNPNPDPTAHRATTILGADTLPEEPAALLGLADDCGLSPDAARTHVRAVLDAVRGWWGVAQANGVSAKEASLMEEALSARASALEAVV